MTFGVVNGDDEKYEVKVAFTLYIDFHADNERMKRNEYQSLKIQIKYLQVVHSHRTLAHE